MSSGHRRRSRTIARDSYALLFAVPEVVTHRLVRMWLAGDAPSQRDRTEFYRMSSEKVTTFYESWNAMFLEMCRANLRLAQSSMWWPWSLPTSGKSSARLSAHGRRAAAAMLGAGLAPIRRRAVANAKRLRRTAL